MIMQYMHDFISAFGPLRFFILLFFFAIMPVIGLVTLEYIEWKDREK